ncbi:MAG TPA: undecaprenyl-phosphate alpha-N-acetylglucosaminyl 1-phosphate transferase [Cyanobacteria bacterium UBA8530]|nr:undecaprenyl-phosphate alpha-N-acetylglucosaminyl 1-phosphate transferase [Cyanobacteria bacterium UBA8530]
MTDLLVPMVAGLAYRIGNLDKPDARKVHSTPIPRLGGIAMFLGVSASLAVLELLVPGRLFPLDGPLQGVFVGATLTFFLGVADDLHPLPAKIKFACQIAIASIAFFLGVRIEFLSNPLTGGIWLLPISLALPLTAFWLVGVTNCINLIDGLDGLAAGISIIAATTIGLIAWQTNQLISSIVAVALVGSAIGFLRYNFNPARIFMGDSGSLFLGFSLAAISVVGVLKLIATAALVLPVLILGVPIFDTAFAILRRLWKHKPIFSPDKGHLHHRLLGIGLSQKKVVVLIYGVSLSFCGLAMLLVKVTGAVTVLLSSLLILTWGIWNLVRSWKESKN